MEASVLFWVVFNTVIVTVLALDLGVLNRRAHKIKLKEALIWSAVWITIALIFNVFVYLEFGKTKALEFLTGYLI
jgi:tellurite resistance protein TerC